MVKKPTPDEWRMTLDFVQLTTATRVLEGWPIPNIQQTLSRLGTLKPKLFGLLDFTAGYHRTPTLRHEPALQCIEAFEYCQQAISNLQELLLRRQWLPLLSHQRQGPCDSILQ